MKEIFQEIEINYEFEIEEIEIAKDHVPIFLSFPPLYSIAKAVGMLKGISDSEVFKKHPEVKKESWGGEIWGNGYCARMVGVYVTTEVIKKYIEYSHKKEKSPKQLKLF